MAFPIREMVEMEIPWTKDCEAPLLDGLAQLHVVLCTAFTTAMQGTAGS